MPKSPRKGSGRMYHTVHALVVREVDYKEQDKILTLLTAENGRMTVTARAARRQGSRHAAAAQSLCFSRMVLSEHRERFTLRETEVLDSFWALRRDIGRLALGAWLADAGGVLMPERSPAPEIFRLTLLALRHIAGDTRPMALVKGAFEMAVMCRAGFAPALETCAHCGKPPQDPALDVHGGVARCRGCAAGAEDAPVPPGVWQALLFLRDAPPEKAFGFTLGGEELAFFAKLCERYFLAHTDRTFASLEFYRKLL